MALDAVANFAKVEVSTGYGSGDTSIVLSSGEGSKLPTAPFNITWYNLTDYPDPADDPNVEIVRVTNIATDTLTVTRAQEGTSASTKNDVGKTYNMVVSPTKKMIDDIQTDLDTKITASSTDTLTNKTFDANGTGNSLSNVDVADLADGTDGELITWDSDGAPATVGAGNSGEVLTSNGAGAAPTFQAAAGGSTPTLTLSGFYESSGRYLTATGGSGSATFTTNALTLNTGATSSSYARCHAQLTSTSTFKVYEGSPTLSFAIEMANAPNNTETYVGLGLVSVSGSGHTFTNDHIGFKIIDDGGTLTLYATQADNTTETVSSALTTITTTTALDLILKVNGTSSVDYYWRKDGGTLSSATNLTTNIPSVNTNLVAASVSNAGTTDNLTFRAAGFTYQR